MSYFFPIPVPFVPGIPIPPFHLNAHSSRPTTASAAKKAAPKRKTQIDTVEITGRTSTNQETPKTHKKFGPKQLLKWVTRSDKKKAAEPTARSFEVLSRSAHQKDQPSKTAITTVSSFEVLSRPKAKPQDEHKPPISNEDAATIAAKFWETLQQPDPEALEGLIDDDEPIDLTLNREATDEMDEKTFKGMSDDDFSDTVRASVKARHATHLQQVKIKPYQAPNSRAHTVQVTEVTEMKD